MDISRIDTKPEDEGTVVQIKDASGQPEDGVTITVAGSYSSQYRRTSSAQRDRMLKQRRTQLSGEQLERNQLELDAACIISWEGFTTGQAPYPLTKENAVALLTKAPWIREQVEEAMQDHASFFSKPAPTS